MSKKYKVVEGCLDRSGFEVLFWEEVLGDSKEEIVKRVERRYKNSENDVFIDGNVVSYFESFFSVIVEEGESVYNLIVDGIENYNECNWEYRDLSIESNFNKICDYFEGIGI